jgi:MFS family permease
LLGAAGLGDIGCHFPDTDERFKGADSIVLLTEAALLLGSAGLAVNASLDRPSIAALYVFAAALAGLDALQRPALEALIPRLVPADEIAAASAVFSMEMTAVMIAGPALGGVLIAAQGAGAAYALDACTFVVSRVVLARMKTTPPPDDAERPSVARVLEGLRYARSRQDLVGTYVVDIMAMVFGMPMALFPAVADDLGGPRTLGLLYAAPSVGAMVAALASGWIGDVRRQGMGISVAACVWGAGIVVFGLSHALVLALVGLVVAGAADMVSGVFRMTMWNQTIPDRLRGRLASIEMLSYSTGPSLGNAEAGLAAAVVGVPAAIVSGGLLCIASVVATTALLPGFRDYRADGKSAELEAVAPLDE